MGLTVNAETHPDLIERLRALRDARREIAEVATKIDNDAKARKAALGLDGATDLIDAEILNILRDAGAPTALMPNGDQIQRVVNTRVEVTDWPAYMAYVTACQNWQLVQQSPGKNAVIEEVQAELDRRMGTLPGDQGAKVLDYFKPENEKELPPIPTVPGVRIAPRYTVKDARKRGSK